MRKQMVPVGTPDGRQLEQLIIGDVAITCIPDLADAAWPAKAIFATLSQDDLAIAATRSPEGTVDPEGRTVKLSFNCYLIQTPGYVALIDAGVGAGKNRPDRPAWHCRPPDFLEALSALEVAPDDISIVVNTHLHADHVGWNTVLQDGRWRPTFPNARYVVTQIELDHWRQVHARQGDGQTLHGAFADSIQPILDGPGYACVAADAEIAPGLVFEPAFGHSPGMVSVRLATDAGEVMFSADTIHHPLQLGDPHIVCNFCTDPEEAQKTRQALLARVAARDMVLAPYHFPAPVFGRLKAEGGTYRFCPIGIDATA
ncbi:MBL fold metallo-hydrolase [Pseudohoeflea coraliihabitans]|uniref:MBL fold metallo-hydrolase n=1 Tax=Pseudohoeflea coraliihabitans TaxID=2860393 RepID=A0ABS6WKD7_9HYPH|nr:MBL fold metallo-hydrolase [Pseudohoeflea sp. DP4N28-3]MBW3096416.1 MBL fold metallo-hydrolase [Pseudohoeflea sp. DP4N28-3]